MGTTKRSTRTQQPPPAGKTPAKRTRAAKRSLPAAIDPANRPLRAYRHGAKALGSFVPKVTQKVFEKYGFSAATLVTDWAAIVGPDLAVYTLPDKLKWPRGVEIYGDVGASDEKGRPGATLILRVDGARALDIQYKASQIMERINAYFGYKAVSSMRIVQAPVTDPAQMLQRDYRKLEPLAQPPAELAIVEDRDLRDALSLMAAGIHRRRTDKQ